ncbi:MAG: putative lipid II flippase FtsW [Acidimicrobiales bacterium]
MIETLVTTRQVLGRGATKGSRSRRSRTAPGSPRGAMAKELRVAASLDQRILVASVAGLCLLGLPMILAASEDGSVLAGASPYGDVIRQCLFMAVGLVCGILAAHLRPAMIRRVGVVLPLAGLALLVAVFLPGMGHSAGGSSRWIGAGPIQLQPSELMKLAVIVFGADLCARRANRKDQFAAVVFPMLLLLAVSGALIVAQPDLGTAIVLSCITFGILFAAGVRLRLLCAVMGLVTICGGTLALHAAYRRDRLLSFLHPFAHASGSGYQVVQSLATLGMGGSGGSGVGGSETPWGYLPNAHTDFVFAVVGGNLGVVGSIAVLAGFACFAWAGIRVALRERDAFTRLVAAGITVWILTQAVINIGGVIDALPVTGIPLPFVSYGGSALIVAMVGAGVLAGIARRQGASAPLGASVLVKSSRGAPVKARRGEPRLAMRRASS